MFILLYERTMQQMHHGTLAKVFFFTNRFIKKKIIIDQKSTSATFFFFYIKTVCLNGLHSILLKTHYYNLKFSRDSRMEGLHGTISCECIFRMGFLLKNPQMYPYTFQRWLSVNIVYVLGYELFQAAYAL
jgi:hypothetical protein